MKLIIVHYHLRPGGVRRIIEQATPHLAREGAVDGVVLATGEASDSYWAASFRKSLRPVPVQFFVEPAFRYFSEQSAPTPELAELLQKGIARLLDDPRNQPCVIWVHNLGIGRNLLLSEALLAGCQHRQIQVMAHHHDWWFDNRWRYWPAMRRCGFRTLRKVAETLFPAAPNVCHATINKSDGAILKPFLRSQVAWLPNLSGLGPAVSPSQTKAVQQALAPGGEPLWLMPARVLRRKNMAEALLLTRWLRPEAKLLSTAGVSSAEESAYVRTLQAAAKEHHWPLALGVLRDNPGLKATVPELMAACEAVLLTSIQEGFGLSFLEAAASGRPLIARAIPNIMSDLRQFGFQFPQSYEEICVAPAMFDWKAERARQEKLFRAWKKQLPSSCQKWAGTPVLLAASQPKAIPYSRLTLTAQLEVLRQPLKAAWKACAPLNPQLKAWRSRAQSGTLEVTPWPANTAEKWLSPEAYARRFWKKLRGSGRVGPTPELARLAQEVFIKRKLAAENLFPLLWARHT